MFISLASNLVQTLSDPLKEYLIQDGTVKIRLLVMEHEKLQKQSHKCESHQQSVMNIVDQNVGIVCLLYSAMPRDRRMYTRSCKGIDR